VSSVTKRLRWALALSIGLNLFLIGFGSSRWWRARSPHGAWAGPGGEHGLARLLGPSMGELREQHRALVDARRAVGAALQADPYDAKQLELALSTLRATTTHSQQALHDRLLKRAPTLTVEERREFAKSRFVRGAAESDALSPSHPNGQRHERSGQ
jgi:uncharacterized membrane protein